MQAKLYIGVTDNHWFEFLSQLQPDEVNFWQPGGKTTFRALEPGGPFLFKLPRPHNHIAGGGYFVSHSFLPLSMAWEVFGTKNGASDFETFRSIILAHRGSDDESDPVIGNIVLNQPFFLPRDRWTPVPPDWSPSTRPGKSYDLSEPTGQRLWHQVQLAQGLVISVPGHVGVMREVGYGTPYLARARLGQGGFRLAVEDAYQKRCAVTGERTRPVLQAAHIKPVTETGPHSLPNGLLLRADLHILLDKGYLTVTDKMRVEISPRIKSDFHNGKQYYALHGQALQVLPDDPALRPGIDYLRWHNDHVFRA